MRECVGTIPVRHPGWSLGRQIEKRPDWSRPTMAATFRISRASSQPASGGVQDARTFDRAACH